MSELYNSFQKGTLIKSKHFYKINGVLFVVIQKEKQNMDDSVSPGVGISLLLSNSNPNSRPLNTIWESSALRVSEAVHPICNEEALL